jgi:MFS family permease
MVILVASVWLLTISAGGMFLIVVALKPIALEFGWPRAVPSLAFSLQFIGSGVGGLLMGYLLDRFGFGLPAAIGTVMLSTGAVLVSLIEPKSAVSGVIDPAHQLYLTYGIMFGLAGQGCLVAPGMANIARFFSRRRGMAVGIVSSGQSLAGIVWPPVFGLVMADHGWRDMFLYFGIFAFCTLVPAVWLVRHKPQAAAAPAPSGDGAARPELPPLSPAAIQWVLCAAIVGCCVAMALPLAHLVAHVTDLGFSVAHGTQVLAVMLIAAFFSRCIMVGLLSDSFGGLTAIFIFSVVQAATLAAFAVVDGLWALYLTAVLFGTGYGGLFPVYAVAIREHVPLHQVGRRTGMVFLFGASAMGLGSWLGGYLFDLTGGYALPFLIGVGFNLLNLAVIGVLISRTGGAGRPSTVPG